MWCTWFSVVRVWDSFVNLLQDATGLFEVASNVRWHAAQSVVYLFGGQWTQSLLYGTSERCIRTVDGLVLSPSVVAAAT